MNVDKIYFITGFHTIKAFLSLYNPEEKNLVIHVDDPVMKKFLESILKDDETLIVPELRMYSRPIPISEFPDYALSVLRHRLKFNRKMRNYSSPGTEAYYFSDLISVNFYILIGALRKLRKNVFFVDPLNNKFTNVKVTKSELGIINNLFLQFLRIIAGVKLAYYSNTWRRFNIGIAETAPRATPEIISWPEISRKFEWKQDSISPNNILFIDGPMQAFSKHINFEQSQQNLVEFFGELLLKGKEIHLKHHVRYPDYNSFTGSEIADQVKIIPIHFPVEMIMNQYSEVYCIYSQSFSETIDGKKYSIFNLMDFKSESSYQRLKLLLDANLIEDRENITFVQKKKLGEPD